MHDEYRKHTSPDLEDPPRETRRRKSTESKDSTDNEISVGTATLELGSPELAGGHQTYYEQYFTVEGRKLMAEQAAVVEYSRTGARPKTNVQE